MKRSYIVVYDKNHEDDYGSLEEELKRCINWWHYLERTWIVITKETHDELWKRLEDKINKEKRFLLIEVNGRNKQGWLEQADWAWIKENLEWYDYV